MNQSYFSDVAMEPIFWFVDNFTHLLGKLSVMFLISLLHLTFFVGPFFVIGVACLTSAVVFVAFWIGLPFWWNKSPTATVFLIMLGHWLLLNVVFHYWKACVTPPGNPPEALFFVLSLE